MRIIAGLHRGRQLVRPNTSSTRPTADRVRETLFNWLSHDKAEGELRNWLLDAIVLDAFAGSGALGFEALSRGASQAFFWDINPEAIRVLRTNQEALRESARSHIEMVSALKPPMAPRPATIVFLDPPYAKGLVQASFEPLIQRGWISSGSLVVVEVGAQDSLEHLPNIMLKKNKTIGAAKVQLFLHK